MLTKKDRKLRQNNKRKNRQGKQGVIFSSNKKGGIFSLGNHLVLYRDMLIYKSHLKYNRDLRESSSLEELCHLVMICNGFEFLWCF